MQFCRKNIFIPFALFTSNEKAYLKWSWFGLNTTPFTLSFWQSIPHALATHPLRTVTYP